MAHTSLLPCRHLVVHSLSKHSYNFQGLFLPSVGANPSLTYISADVSVLKILDQQ